MNRQLLILIFITLVIKAILVLVMNDWGIMNPDEEFNYRNAAYALHETASSQAPEKFTAFHGYAPVFVYELLLRYHISKEIWVAFVYAITLILFAFSVISFYNLSLIFLPKGKFAFYATLTYCFYPSILYYVGSLFFYENFVLAIMVIIVYKLVRSLEQNFSVHDYFIIPLGITISCLYRGQVIIIYFIVLAFYFYFSIKKKRVTLLPMIIAVAFLAFMFHLPILIKNKEKFGRYILSTQYGFELLQGHNPTARGSWMAGSSDSSNVLFQYVHRNIPDASVMNEYEECEARKQLALKWIKENPVDDLKLEIKKMAIFFYPANYEVHKTYDWFNPVNFLVHVLFVLAVLIKIFKRNMSAADAMILAPVAGSVILTLIFFTGYRWRYYAEPFMIIFAWQFLATYILRKKRAVINSI